MNEISLIIPCYNEEKAIPIFYDAAAAVLRSMKVSYELIFVDDGSRDDTLKVLQELAGRNACCKYLSFSRNFGKEAAIYAGLKNSCGRYTAVMDVDLQDPPYLLREMYQILEHEDYDCVAARRKNRDGEPKLRSFLSDLYYKVINKFSQTEIVSGARDFRLMTRRMVDAVLELGEKNRFSKGIFQWVGFNTKWLEYEYTRRCAGETKWPFRKLVSYAVSGMTGFSVAPLTFGLILGLIFCMLSFAAFVILLVRGIAFHMTPQTWQIIVSALLFVSGCQLISSGIIGEYLAKTYLEVKNRPVFILKASNICEGLNREYCKEEAVLHEAANR